MSWEADGCSKNRRPTTGLRELPSVALALTDIFEAFLIKIYVYVLKNSKNKPKICNSILKKLQCMNSTTILVRERRKWLKDHHLAITLTDRELARIGVQDPRLHSGGKTDFVLKIEDQVAQFVAKLDQLIREEFQSDYLGTTVRYDWRRYRRRSWGGQYSEQFVTRYGDQKDQYNGISLALSPEILNHVQWEEYTHIAHSPTIGDLTNLKQGEMLACLCCHEVAHAIDKGMRGHGLEWQKIYRRFRVVFGLVAPWWDPSIEEPEWDTSRKRRIKDPQEFQRVCYSEDYFRQLRRKQQAARRERKRKKLCPHCRKPQT